MKTLQKYKDQKCIFVYNIYKIYLSIKRNKTSLKASAKENLENHTFGALPICPQLLISSQSLISLSFSLTHSVNLISSHSHSLKPHLYIWVWAPI